MARNDELDLERLALIAGGHTAFQLLYAGVELNLYAELSKRPGLTLDDIAVALGLAHQAARILLVGLTALGIIINDDGHYRNADLTEQRLVPEKPGFIAPVLGWQYHIVYPGLLDFVESLKQNTNVGLRHFPGPGNTLYQRLTAQPKLETIFQHAMSALSKQANTYLMQAIDLAGSRHLVDMGGGDGTNAIALTRKYPQLKATVFDSSSVCEIAKKNIAQAGLGDRVGTWEGDMFRDPLPPGVDAVLYAHILTIWSPEKNIALLKKTHAALSKGGKVLLFNMMARDDDSGPLTTALGSPYFLAIATGEGMLYSWKDYEGWLKQAGFGNFQRIGGLPLDHGLLIGTKE